LPRRDDIHTILVAGSGPIVIGQAAEFDYSGTQAVKALRKEGYRVVLVNSNPATVMTDPELADATYIEPLTPEALEAIIAQEKPDAFLPTVGGQTGLNLALALSENGVLARYGVSLIGANLDSIRIAEDRAMFRDTLQAHGIPVPKGGPAGSPDEAAALAGGMRYPLLVRASFALGGSGASWVETPDGLEEAVHMALGESPIGQAWLEESVLGWKEFELEVMRDAVGNFVVVCAIENLDPMGVHTGDSITVAPAQTLTDREYQVLRDLARQVMDAVGVATGGSNVQFCVNPRTGEALVIEMNPRVSRSSALASKATGFPIAKIAALVAVGYRLDEIPNDITGETTAAFEPALDYVVVKIPRWTFEKFPGADDTLGPQMKSVGETMALGRTFNEALNKAVQSLEIGADSLAGPDRLDGLTNAELLANVARPHAERLFVLYRLLKAGMSTAELAEMTRIDPWFVEMMAGCAALEAEVGAVPLNGESLRRAKREGFSDTHLARLGGLPGGGAVRTLRKELGVLPTFLRVDTCAAEFQARTPYLYSSYEDEDESQPQSEQPKVMILGSGPNRIGQGIEFDYCCCQAAFALGEQGYEVIMVNCNPETVSTDYDTSHRLYFEPMTLEHILNVYEREQPLGVILQLGGQTPLNLAAGLAAAGVPVLGTSPDSIRLAEDREAFARVLRKLELPHPEYGIARSAAEAGEVARRIGYPVLVRPSFVLGGRAMAVVGDAAQMETFARLAEEAAPGKPILVDRFMDDAYEIDVDALCDGRRVIVVAVMQHIEEAGVHSGDSACILPPYKVSAFHLETIREYTQALGLALGVRGLLNVQYAIKDDVVYILEANPRASRTVPFAGKATGLSMARAAARIAVGQTLDDLELFESPRLDGFFVKEAVLPFRKLPSDISSLGPEMRSTGEVMGQAAQFGHAFAKAQLAAGNGLPLSGVALISVNDYDKGAALKIARDLHRLGFEIAATAGTAEYFARTGLPVTWVNKVTEGSPHVVDWIREGRANLVLNTPLGSTAHSDGARMRAAAALRGTPILTTLSAAAAAVAAIRSLQQKELSYHSLQEHFKPGGTASRA
jgi:carbamoyl-phosphate synthase large subunit